MEHKIAGSYYLVECPEWSDAGFEVAEYTDDPGDGPQWIAKCGKDISKYVTSYKALDKVGKMHPFAVLSIKK